MTDLEMTRLCAEAMGYEQCTDSIMGGPALCFDPKTTPDAGYFHYDPFHNDDQTMQLLLWLLSCGEKIVIENNERGNRPILVFKNAAYRVHSLELLRGAIVECVAKVQKEKQK